MLKISGCRQHSLIVIRRVFRSNFDDMMATVAASKAALRKEIKEKLALLSSEEKRVQSERVAQKLFSLPAFQHSQRVSIYLSTDLEIATVPILERIFADNKKCFIPRYSGNRMEMVRLMSIMDYQGLPMTKWNIKQPNLNESRENALDAGGLDLILLPGVAFSSRGDRCGHGKGYYDSFLKSIKQSEPPRKIGLAFKEQIVENLPTTEHDVKLDMVLYDN